MSYSNNNRANRTTFTSLLLLRSVFFLALLLAPALSFGQNNQSDQKLIDEFIKSRGTQIITFDASNIKQFWIEKTVLSKDGSVIISLNNDLESELYPIKLVNVNKGMDCAVEVLTESSNVKISVYNSKKQKIKSSFSEDTFITYHLLKTTFHLEDTQDNLFYLSFSNNAPTISLQKILLSFSNNRNGVYVFPNDRLNVTKDSLIIPSKGTILSDASNSFSLKFTDTVFTGKNFICVSDNEAKVSFKVKNTSDVPVRLIVGFAAHYSDCTRINRSQYPYGNLNEVLSVLSLSDDKKTLVVDKYPTSWAKRCTIGINAKDDMSELPNKEIADCVVVDVKKCDDGKAEISVDKPIDLETGTKIRIHSNGGSNIYPYVKNLQPGEEDNGSFVFAKDEKFIKEYSTNFAQDLFFVRLLILPAVVNSDKEGTLQFSDFTVSYQ